MPGIYGKTTIAAACPVTQLAIVVKEMETNYDYYDNQRRNVEYSSRFLLSDAKEDHHRDGKSHEKKHHLQDLPMSLVVSDTRSNNVQSTHYPFFPSSFDVYLPP
jgi:hypothetical protein